MAKLKVGVVGVGALGSIHARIYSELESVELVGICDIDKGRLRDTQDKLGVEGHTDYRKLIGHVDAVSVVVPTNLHFPISKDLLKAGVHLLIEKPITETVEQADELLEIAGANKLALAVGHIERFNAAIEAIQRLKGDIKFIECHRLGPFAPRIKDVGVVLDLMIHDIDIILGLVRSPVKSIEAVGVKILSKNEDIANARISFENGAVCNITASRVTAYTMRKIRMFQPNAYISLDYVKQDAVIYKKQLGRIVSEQIDIKKEKPLQKEIASFVECVRSGKKPLVSGEDGRQALSVATEILKKINEAIT
ncbi:MAG: Gfo/Idh/MocA family oxidoreductase [Candidatus Omnitrophica bacterium]|nr:Gfo/Idh/MocA family oxidoreductase [Candidatus Omnitrophota bacterium]